MTPLQTETMRLVRRPRSGAALVVAMICLLMVTSISAVLVRVALVQREQLERDGWRTQADWLALSAWERAVARRAADPEYAGETWRPKLRPEGAPIGRVEIEIRESADGGARPSQSARITVNVPDAPVDRAHVVRVWSIPPGESSSEGASASVDQ